MSEGIIIAKSDAKKELGETSFTDDVNMKTKSSFFSFIKPKPVNSVCSILKSKKNEAKFSSHCWLYRLIPINQDILGFLFWISKRLVSEPQHNYLSWLLILFGRNYVQDTPKQTRSDIKDYL